MTYVAISKCNLDPFPGRLHQAMPFTIAGWQSECRQRQHPEIGPHSFTFSSLAHVIRIWPVGSHFILTRVSLKWQGKKKIIEIFPSQILYDLYFYYSIILKSTFYANHRYCPIIPSHQTNSPFNIVYIIYICYSQSS